jgi:uncharacterized protein
VDLLIAVPLGFVLGFLIGLTGVGGGALVAPALYVILSLAYDQAVTLSLVYSLFTKIAGAVQHFRQGTILWKISWLYGLAGIPGAILGSHLVYWVSEETRRLLPNVMAGVLLLISALLLLETIMRPLAKRERPFSPHRIGWAGGMAIVILQLVVGVLLGVTSVGAGSLVVLSMFFLFQMSAREIVGSNIVIALIMVIPAALTHYLAGGVEWRLLAALLLGSLGGAVLGSRAVLAVPERSLKLAIVVLIALGAIATVARPR